MLPSSYPDYMNHTHGKLKLFPTAFVGLTFKRGLFVTSLSEVVQFDYLVSDIMS